MTTETADQARITMVRAVADAHCATVQAERAQRDAATAIVKACGALTGEPHGDRQAPAGPQKAIP